MARLNPRSAKKRATQQRRDRAASLTQKRGSIKTFIDPRSGVDTRFIDEEGRDTRRLPYGHPDQGKMVQGTLFGGRVSGVQAPTSGAEALSDLQTAGKAGSLKTGRTHPGSALMSPEAGAGGRAGARGFTPQTFSHAAGSLKAKSQQEVVADQEREISRIKGYESVPMYDEEGNVIGYNEVESKQKTAELQEQARQRMAIEAQNVQLAREQESRNIAGRSVDQGYDPRPVQTSLDDALTQNIVSALPEGYEFLGQALQNELSTQREVSNLRTDAMRTQLSNIDAAFDIENELQSQGARARQTFSKVETMLDDTLERKEKLFSAQQKNELDWLSSLEASQKRSMRKNLRTRIDEMTVTAALMNRAGSTKANYEIEAAEYDGEQAILDMQREIGFARNDIMLGYTEDYINAIDTYQSNWLTRKDTLDAELGRIEAQGITNRQLKEERIKSVMNDWLNGITQDRKDTAKSISDAAKTVSDVVSNEKAAILEAAQYDRDREWDVYKLHYNKDIEMMKFSMQQAERDETQQIRIDDQQLRRMDSVVNQLSSRIARDKVVQSAEEVDGYYRVLDTSYQKAVELQDMGILDKKSYNAVDNSMITAFMKMTDPGSVVRESEFARIPENMSAMDKLRVLGIKALAGGTLTVGERKSISDLAIALNGSWQDLLNERKERYHLQLGLYNDSVPEQYKLTPDQFGLETYTTTTDRMEYDDLLPEDYQSPYFNAEPGDGRPVNPFARGGGESSTGAQIISMGRTTQTYDTKIGNDLYPDSVITAWGGKHRGIDVAMPQNSLLQSIVGGKVIESKYEGGWGGTVVVEDENGAQHRFSHLSRLGVKKGDKIEAGDLIALTGGQKGTRGAGTTTGPHLDYRIKIKGKYIDPMTYNPSKYANIS